MNNNQSQYSRFAEVAGDSATDMSLFFSNPATGAEWELEVRVTAEYEPAQRGGMYEPSWEGYWHSPVAYWFRPHHGWKEVCLNETQENEICVRFADMQTERRRRRRELEFSW